ncbi:MAG: hypothetical protein ACP5GD_00220 [Candidatus Micrarchaeia archaeon]
MKLLPLLFAFASMVLANAAYLSLTYPVQATLHNGSSLYLGKVGPGESFYIDADADTTNANGMMINIGWDTLQTISLPSGWTSQPSPLYANPMKLKITVAQNAPNGTYAIVARAVNIGNYSGLGNLTFTAFINVTPDVLIANVSPLVLHSGVGQPVNLHIFINNTGASDDPFLLYTQGLPAFAESYEVIAKKDTPTTFYLPVYENEPGVYHFKLFVASATSSLVKKVFPETLIVNVSVGNDYAALSQGILISPITYEPAYVIMQLLRLISR